jgi:F-type H+-transporting ATPase subunit b
MMRRAAFWLMLAVLTLPMATSSSAEPVSSADQTAIEATTPAAQLDPAADPAQPLEGVPAGDAYDPAHSKDGKNAKKGGLPQFDPSSFTSQIFWLVICFGAMFIFFSKKTLPDIAGIMNRRAAHIEHDIATAQKLRESAEEAKARFERAVGEAQQKSTTIFVKAEQEVKAKITGGLEEFKNRSLMRLKDAEDSIEHSKKEALEGIQQVAAEVASIAAEKIVGISTDIDQAKNVVRNINKRAA